LLGRGGQTKQNEMPGIVLPGIKRKQLLSETLNFRAVTEDSF